MSVRNVPPKISLADLDRQVDRALPTITLIGVAIVLIATLFPFNFSGAPNFSVEKLADFFSRPSDPLDRVGNLLMLFPFGFGLSGWLIGKQSGKLGAAIVVLLASLFLSFVVESCQMFLPQRYPTLIDLFTNSLSGCLGCLGYDRWKAFIAYYSIEGDNRPISYFSLLKWVACFLAYILLTFGSSLALQELTQPDNWQENFPLAIGNEVDGSRLWQGSVSELAIADRALTPEEIADIFARTPASQVFGNSLVASYPLTGEDGNRDRAGSSPDLSPQTASSPAGERTWLATTEPAQAISQRIRQTSQFTLSAIVATASTTQTGPARIISLSGDVYRRNLTLAQNETDLVVRLRSPITGRNGAEPHILVPNLLSDTEPHHLVVSYDGSVLEVYRDRLQDIRAIDLKSGLALYHLFGLPVKATTIDARRWLFYSIIFIPLGLWLGCIPIRSRLWKLYLPVATSLILLPTVLLEAILAVEAGTFMRSDNLLLSFALMSVSLLVLKVGKVAVRSAIFPDPPESESIASKV